MERDLAPQANDCDIDESMNFSLDVVSNSSEIGEENSSFKDGSDIVTSKNVGTYVTIMTLRCWKSQHDSDTEMRKTYAKILMVVLGIQIFLSFLVFLGIGLKLLIFDEYTIRLFVTVAYVQAMGLVYIVVKYLFSKESHIPLRDIGDCTNKFYRDEKK